MPVAPVVECHLGPSQTMEGLGSIRWTATALSDAWVDHLRFMDNKWLISCFDLIGSNWLISWVDLSGSSIGSSPRGDGYPYLL